MQRLCVQGKVTDFMVISKDMPQPTIYKRTRSRRRSLERSCWRLGTSRRRVRQRSCSAALRAAMTLSFAHSSSKLKPGGVVRAALGLSVVGVWYDDDDGEAFRLLSLNWLHASSRFAVAACTTAPSACAARAASSSPRSPRAAQRVA